MVRKRKDPPAPEPDPQPDYVAEQLAALAQQVDKLEAELAALKAGVAANLGIAL